MRRLAPSFGIWFFLSPLLAQPAAEGTDSVRSIAAFRVTEEIVVDGLLNEASWALAEPAKDFIQTEPDVGQPATEQTEVRILYDDKNLYFGAHCFDSAAPGGLVVNDLRRDFSTRDNDVFEIVLDTFDDDRNGFLFGTNPRSALFDGQFGSEGGSFNRDWDGIWYVKAEVGPDGWTVEIVIPFKTLRFTPEEAQTWGVNFLRRIRRKNEDSYWSPIPQAFRITKVSYAGELAGMKDIPPSRNLTVKPYLAAPVVRREDDDIDFLPDVGVDIKYGVTSQLTLDGTLNTDFSQVEADEERVNLTRFSLFFPEKRDFFLENANIFQFGPASRGEGGGGGRPDLVPFFSRRIGIDESDDEQVIVPILAGARLSGRAGPYTVGVLSMQTASSGTDVPSNNFAVVRVRRDILSRSDFGGIFVSKYGDGRSNLTYGADANFNFARFLRLSGYLLKTGTEDLKGDDAAGNFEAEWDDNKYRLKAGYLSIQENFNPEVGFAPRTGIRKSYGDFGYFPRPGETIPFIRQMGPEVQLEYITNQENVLETRLFEPRFEVRFQNSSEFRVGKEYSFERLTEDFEIRDDQVIPVGDYHFDETSVSYSSDRSRLFSGDVRYATGGFYDGTRDSVRMGVRVQPGYRFSADASWSQNQVDLPSGAFTTDLVTTRVRYSFSTKMFLNTLIQYNSESGEISSNVRYNYIFKPLSDFFLVYNERRSSTGELLDWAIIAKITYLLSF